MILASINYGAVLGMLLLPLLLIFQGGRTR